MIVPINQNYTFIAAFGTSRTGKTVKFQIIATDGVTVLSPSGSTQWTLSIVSGDADTYVTTGSVVELGEGEYGIIINFKIAFSGFIRFWDETDNLIASDPIIVIQDWPSELKRLLGLSHENVTITDPVYDSYNNLQSATLTVYDDKTLVTSVASYTITAVGTGVNKFSTWQQIKN